MEKKQRSIITITTIIVAALLTGWFIQHFFYTEADLDQQLLAISSELNKTCPLMVDSETRLDNTVSGPGNYFTYNYTFVNYVSEQFDAKILEPNIRPMIVNTIKTHPDMKIFRENKITMHYTYKDKVGFVVMKIEIKPQEYAN